jgi:hypothetical protein
LLSLRRPRWDRKSSKLHKDQPQGQTKAPDHTVPPPPEAQPQAPIADQSKPAAVGPSRRTPRHQLQAQAAVLWAPRPQTIAVTNSAENAKRRQTPDDRTAVSAEATNRKN